MTECVTHVPEHPLPISPVYTEDSGRAARPARALRQAVAIDPRQPGVPSSKGTLNG